MNAVDSVDHSYNVNHLNNVNHVSPVETTWEKIFLAKNDLNHALQHESRFTT